MESSGSEAMNGFITNIVNRVAREKGWREAMVADYVLREVVIGRSRDPRLIRLAFYYMGSFSDLREEDEKLRRELRSMFPLAGSREEDDRRGGLEDRFGVLRIFAGA